MTHNNSNVLAVLILLGIGCLPTNASALVKWTFQSGSSYCVSNCTGNTPNKVFKTSFDNEGFGNNVTVTGWANTEPGSTNTDLAQGSVSGPWTNSGIGVVNDDASIEGEGTSTGEHGMDNQDRFDLLLFDTGKAVALSDVTVGWSQNDRDIMVLAYTGGGTPTLDGVQYTNPEELTGTGGWTHLGNYQVPGSGSGDGTQAISNPTDIASSYWIVAAYNPAFASFGCETGGCGSGAKDYMKILALQGRGVQQVPGVPEPPALMLLALGLPLVHLSRRLKG